MTESAARKDLRVEEVRGKKDLMTFIRFPWKIYRGNRYWIPPLIKENLSKFSRLNPFQDHAEMILLFAVGDGEVLGRVAGIIDRNYLEFHQEKTGFFGFFESVKDEEVSRSLLSRVADWLRDRGMTKMIGPMNPSTNDECGLLLDRFDSSPMLMMPYNPPYYPSLLEAFGLRKAMDLYAYRLDSDSFSPDRLVRITERLAKKEPRLKIRPLNLRHFDEELKIVKEIYNGAWSKNWGFVPMTEREVDYLAKQLRPLVDPDLVLFGYWEDEPVAFSVALPNYNEVLKRLDGRLGPLGLLKFLYYSRRIRALRIMLLGVKHAFQKRGLEGFLYLETFRKGIEKHYREAECSWILETNLLMQRGIEAMGGKRDKTYRIYEMDL